MKGIVPRIRSTESIDNMLTESMLCSSGRLRVQLSYLAANKYTSLLG